MRKGELCNKISESSHGEGSTGKCCLSGDVFDQVSEDFKV